MTDEEYMQIAIDYAMKKDAIWPFAALIVNGAGDVLIKAVNASHIDSTYHGEMVALRAFAKEYKREDIEGPLTLYTTGECCPMCQSAIYWANLSGMGIQKVVYGSTIPTLNEIWGTQINILSQEVVGKSPDHKVTLVGQVLEEACNQLFYKAKRRQVWPSSPTPTKELSSEITDFYETPQKALVSQYR